MHAFARAELCAQPWLVCKHIKHGRTCHIFVRMQYVPRQDGGATINGNVGQYEIRLSTDGTTFPTATVAKGTWPNTAAAKYVTFPAANAKAVRLTALTEAGGNGPWTSAAEVNVLGTVVTRPDSSAIGSWGELVKFPLVPVAAAMTTSGNVRPRQPPALLSLPIYVHRRSSFPSCDCCMLFAYVCALMCSTVSLSHHSYRRRALR